MHNIKKIRLELGLSQSEFAEKTKIKLKTLQFWEQGRRNPGVKNLTLIAKVLDLKIEELLGSGAQDGNCTFIIKK